MYFGLADEDDYEEDIEPYHEPEAEAQHAYSDRPNVRRLSSRRRRDANWLGIARRRIAWRFYVGPGPSAGSRHADDVACGLV